MLTIPECQSSYAKAHFSSLLDQVEEGQMIAITRHGKRIARLIPEEKTRNRQAMDQAWENMKKLKQEIAADWKKRGLKPLTIDEIIAMKNEGRRY
jgi:prevent-host-death family protein